MRGDGRAWQSTMMSMSVADRLAHRRDARARRTASAAAPRWASSGHGHRLERGEAVARPPCGASSPNRFASARIGLVEILHLPPPRWQYVGCSRAPGRPTACGTGTPWTLPDDVPQGEVDAADRRRADDAVAVPEVLPVHHLPQMLDARRDPRRPAARRCPRSRRRPPACAIRASPRPSRTAPAGRSRTFTNTQLRIRAWQTCVSMAVIFMPAVRTLRSRAALASIRRSTSPRSNGLASRIRVPHPLNSSNGLAAIAVPANPVPRSLRLRQA